MLYVLVGTRLCTLSALVSGELLLQRLLLWRSGYVPRRPCLRRQTCSFLRQCFSDTVLQLICCTQLLTQRSSCPEQVISALAESSAAVRGSNEPPPHIPYRDSKLTKLLMDSLVGLPEAGLLSLHKSHMSKTNGRVFAAGSHCYCIWLKCCADCLRALETVTADARHMRWFAARHTSADLLHS